MSAEEKKNRRAGRELLSEELEQVVGGELSDGEINAYLSQYDDPESLEVRHRHTAQL